MENIYGHNEYKRGEIYHINDEGGTTGSEQKSGRPAVIVSNDKNNNYSGTVTIVYCTSSPKKIAKNLPTHVIINSTDRVSVVLGEQPTTVSKYRIGDYVGMCTDEEMSRINEALKVQLALRNEKEEHKDISEASIAEDETDYKAQCIMLKKMYDELLDKVIRNRM